MALLKSVRILSLSILPFLGALVILAACSRENKEKSVTESAEVQDEYYADHDIAMIVKSIADAINVGEPLDTAEYNYEGILTDGRGAPLYTDVQGMPGIWEVDVISSDRAVLRNIYLGDLLPKDLENYICSVMRLGDVEKIESTEYDDDDETELSVYSVPGGFLRFEIRSGIAPNGLEGPLMSIVITSADS